MGELQVQDVDLTLPDLIRCLEELLAQVPSGRVTTYGSLAEGLGSAAAARWVGHWMMHHDHGPGCPCHRVVRADGSLGLYVTGNADEKAALLRGEGVSVEDESVQEFSERVFRTFRSARPLIPLREMQEELGQKVSLRGRTTMPGTVAGVDVSYSENHGTGAYVLWDVRQQELIWSTTVTQEVTFPYITGYLAFRELPLLLALMDAARTARRLGDVVIVDGSGLLHPRGVGIACHLGVLTDVPTIGVSKKLLCGDVDIAAMAAGESRAVVQDGHERGRALRATGGSARPIFISPGHRISAAMAERVVRGQLLGRRLPEVQYWADRLSREAARARL